MCGRFALKKAHLAQIAKAAAAIMAEGALPASRFNIPPGGPIPVIRNRPSANVGDGRELTALHWGLMPAGAAADARPLNNARAETVADKPTFRDAFRRRRCLIPASAFYEWTTAGGPRQPWAFLRADEEPFCLGGLWDGDRCTVVTTAANAVMSPVHHRMPVLLATDAELDTWLDPRIDSAMTSAALAALLRPAPDDRLVARPVSARINATANDDEACLADAPLPATPTDTQLGFGW